jgi:hypothetical protein
VSGAAVRLVAFGLVAAGAAAAVWAVMVPITSNGERMDSTRLSASTSLPPSGDPAPETVVAQAVRRPLFRPGRRPAAIGFDPARAVGASPEASAPPVERPPLALSGIVWGGEPAAIVEGMPGVDGSTVLRRGESASGIRVVRIERTRVVLVGRDTVWTLEVRDPWK